MSASPTREPSSTFHYWSSRGADAASRAERHRRAASAEDAAHVLPLLQQATAQFSGCWKIHTSLRILVLIPLKTGERLPTCFGRILDLADRRALTDSPPREVLGDAGAGDPRDPRPLRPLGCG